MHKPYSIQVLTGSDTVHSSKGSGVVPLRQVHEQMGKPWKRERVLGVVACTCPKQNLSWTYLDLAARTGIIQFCLALAGFLPEL